MKPTDRGSTRYTVDTPNGVRVYNYRSNFDWATLAGVGQQVQAGSTTEQLFFACHAVGKACLAPPPPPPAPGPSAPVSATCQGAIEFACKATAPAGCSQCVKANARKFMQAGCPPANDNGFARSLAFCRTL